MTKILYGHRGAAGEAPENTLDGFRHARQIGVRAFELDVRLSVNGQLVVIHDETLERTANTRGSVSEFTAAQLHTLDARGRWTAWHNPVGVPLLAEVLQSYHDLDAFQIEIKSAPPRILEQVCAQVIVQVESFEIAERTIVTSFDPVALTALRRRAPQLRRGFIAPFDKPEHLETAMQLGCWNVCIPLATGTEEMVRAAQAKGFDVTGWLGNATADLEILLEWGVDSITSDYPSIAIPFLNEHHFFD